MPADRFIHPALGQSEKVNLLTELEFRVWIQYLLSADDYGVMRCSAVTVQSMNDALHAKASKTVQRCLERLLEVKLVMEFEHQGRRYLCQQDWQRWQRVKFPRTTTNPVPPSAVLALCDESTRGLFLDHHPMSIDAHQVVEVDAHQRSHLLTAQANGNRQMADVRESFSEFWKEYPRKVGKDVAWRIWQKLNPDSDLQAKIHASLSWQRQQEGWKKDGGQFVPHPSSYLNQRRWEDERPPLMHIKRAVDVHQQWVCPHDPPCEPGTTAFYCDRRTKLEAGRKAIAQERERAGA